MSRLPLLLFLLLALSQFCNRENLREAISLLSETVKEEEKAKADRIWMELAESKEQEDVVSRYGCRLEQGHRLTRTQRR